MTDLNDALKVLSHPTRRLILGWLARPEDSFQAYTQLYDFSVYGVCASLIQDKAGLSQPATSQSLKALGDQGWVIATKVGKWTYYKRDEARLQAVVSQLVSNLKV
ncbi:ArsR family transcriptional regulator [Pseudomonas sp. dw_358]|uniref:ArsR/SmtB family transcription factor n=1 Tax=Pseudomonas sp. dw_358 TaxID=2720083 RepID=UPI001BD5D197|nr:ArsR family transcriptional regulator [Pseudomonas sp. dw_358]